MKYLTTTLAICFLFNSAYSQQILYRPINGINKGVAFLKENNIFDKSGSFIGKIIEDAVYNENGKQIFWFRENRFYDLNGYISLEVNATGGTFLGEKPLTPVFSQPPLIARGAKGPKPFFQNTYFDGSISSTSQSISVYSEPIKYNNSSSNLMSRMANSAREERLIKEQRELEEQTRRMEVLNSLSPQNLYANFDRDVVNASLPGISNWLQSRKKDFKLMSSQDVLFAVWEREGEIRKWSIAVQGIKGTIEQDFASYNRTDSKINYELWKELVLEFVLFEDINGVIFLKFPSSLQYNQEIKQTVYNNHQNEILMR